MTTAAEALHLAEQLRRHVAYIRRSSGTVTWGNRLTPFANEGERLAAALEDYVTKLENAQRFPKQPTGSDVAATATLGPLELTAADVGESFNGMIADWSLGTTPPAQVAPFVDSGGITVGYLTISGNATEDFDGIVEIIGSGSVGVGTYRFSPDGGANWHPTAPIVSFSHVGASIAFADAIDVPDVVPEAAGELPLVATYAAGAQASWSSRGFDKLTLTQGGTVETFDYLRPGATWFTQGAAKSSLVESATWATEERPTPGTSVFSGGESRVSPDEDEQRIGSSLTDAYDAATAWKARWVFELSSYLVTRSPTAPPI